MRQDGWESDPPRPLPRIPRDSGCGWVIGLIAFLVICGGLVAYFNYQANQGGTGGASQTHQKSVPSEAVPDQDARR